MKDNQNGEPIVLGELKKEKSSRPVFVFVVLAAIIALLWFMPQIQDYFNHSQGTIPELYRATLGKLFGAESDYYDEIEEAKEEEKPVLLKEDTVLTKMILTVSKISIKDNKITYTVASKTEVNLDNSNFTIEVYSNSDTLLGKVKLTGTANTTSAEVTQDLSFQASSESYYVKLTN